MQVERAALQRRRRHITMVEQLVDEALTADRIVAVREGRLEQVGTATEIYQRPAPGSRWATFLGARSVHRQGRTQERRRDPGRDRRLPASGSTAWRPMCACCCALVLVAAADCSNGSPPLLNVPNTIGQIEQKPIALHQPLLPEAPGRPGADRLPATTTRLHAWPRVKR